MGVADIQKQVRQAIGAVKDHASIGKAMIYNSLISEGKGFSDIEIAVVRATGHDDALIDDNHMHEILFLVSNSPGSIPFLAERISRRLAKTRDHLVALKTLLLVHRLLRGGNRSFEQQLRGTHASGHLQITPPLHCSFAIHNNNTSSPIHPSLCFFLRKYAAYLEERIGWVINQAGKLEPAVMSPPSLELVRCYDDKAIDMVFRKLPKCQAFIDRVLEFFPSAISDNNLLLAQAAMINTLRESFQVYTTYCEGVASLVNMFFDLTRPARALGCQILKRASQQSKRLHSLYENCKTRIIIGNKNLEYPSVQIITLDHVMALEQCSSANDQNNPATSLNASSHNHHHLDNINGNSSTSTPGPLLDCFTESAKLQAVAIPGSGKQLGQKGGSNLSFSSSTTLFSCTLETKISKVWVLFEDDEDHM